MRPDGDTQGGFYKNVKIAGLLLFIPLILPSGPLAGYYCADFLVKRYSFPEYCYAIFVVIGLLAGFAETARIIKLAIKTAKTE